MLGKVASARKDDMHAEEAYAKAYALDPNYTEAGFNYVLALERQGQEPKAMEIYRKLSALTPPHAEASYNLGLYDLRHENPASAIDAFRRALQASAEYEAARYNLGLALLRAENYPGAAGEFERVAKQNPKNFSAWYNLGIARARAEDFAGAESAMRKAFELNPVHDKAAIYLVRYLTKLGREKEKVAIYMAAEKGGIADADVCREAASWYVGQKDDASAARAYATAARLDPTPATYFNLGLALRRLDRLEEAGEAYRKATELKPDFARAWLNLGYIRMYLKDYDGAEAHFRKALALQPNYDKAKDALVDLDAARKDSKSE